MKAEVLIRRVSEAVGAVISPTRVELYTAVATPVFPEVGGYVPYGARMASFIERQAKSTQVLGGVNDQFLRVGSRTPRDHSRSRHGNSRRAE